MREYKGIKVVPFVFGVVIAVAMLGMHAWAALIERRLLAG